MLDPRKSKKMVNGNPSRESQKNILGVLKKSCSYACTTCNKQIFSPQSTPAHTQPRKHADDLLTLMGVGCLMEAWRCHLHAPKRVGHICSEKTHTTKKIFSAIVVVSQSLPAKHHLWIGDKEIMSRRNSPGLKKASISLSGLLWIWHSEQALLYITNLQASLALKNTSESKAGFLFLQYGQGKCCLLDGKK